MFHIGMDMHKKFSRVEVMDEEGKDIDKRLLFHPFHQSILLILKVTVPPPVYFLSFIAILLSG